MTSFGRIKEFRPEEETIDSYLERIEIFFTANGIAADKQVPVFLSVIGSKTYAILRSLVAPAKPTEKDFAALSAELKKHFEPSKIVIAKRFHFHRRSQGPEETVSEFLAELRRTVPSETSLVTPYEIDLCVVYEVNRCSENCFLSVS